MLLRAERNSGEEPLYKFMASPGNGDNPSSWLTFQARTTTVRTARTCILLHIAACWLALSRKGKNLDSFNAAIAASKHLEEALPIRDILNSAAKKHSVQSPDGAGGSPGMRGLQGVARLAKARCQWMHQKTMPSWRLAPLEMSRSIPHLGDCASRIHAFLQPSQERRLQAFDATRDGRRGPWRTFFYIQTFPGHGWTMTRKGFPANQWKRAALPPPHATRLQAISHFLRVRWAYGAGSLHEITVEELLENRQSTGNTIRETDLMCFLPHLRVMRKLEAYEELK
jgi:hypothetical protein